MAGLSISPETRGQLAAISRVRWQLFVNSLRTIRGRLEIVTRVFMTLGFAIAGVGGSIGLAIASWYLVSHNRSEFLAVLLWPIFIFWQLFPVMATAFTENFDSSNLLRFPLSYSSFFLIRIAYGSIEPATALGSLWLLGILIGVGTAIPALFPWVAMVVLSFALVNILLARMIFSWIERWLAQRRTREIFGVVFLLFAVGFQLLGPLLGRYSERGPRSPLAAYITALLLPLERALPPGLAAEAVAGAIRGSLASAFGFLMLLFTYGLVILWFLHVRLRAQFLGENLSETAARKVSRTGNESLRLGWSLFGLPGPVAAVFEKEFHYLSRSGPMLFSMIMPMFILVLFRLAPAHAGRGGGFLSNTPDLAFPAGAAYTLLILTNLVYNSFGADAGGIQLFFVSPARFREILLGKNLAHAGVLALQITLVYVAVCLLFRPPALDVFFATLSGVLFGLLVNLAAGNLLSLQSPRKIDYGAFGRQRASNVTMFASIGIQLLVIGLGALVLLAARAYGRIWIATILFLVLAAAAFVGYSFALRSADRIALEREETLISELSRAS
jgi:ABC-2 type transport system permease protein